MLAPHDSLINSFRKAWQWNVFRLVNRGQEGANNIQQGSERPATRENPIKAFLEQLAYKSVTLYKSRNHSVDAVIFNSMRLFISHSSTRNKD